MSGTILIYLDDETEARLEHAADVLERAVPELAESLVSEGALMYAQTLKVDPGRNQE